MDRKALVSSIHKHHGVVSKVAKDMGVSFQAIYKAKNKSKSIASAIKDARESYTVETLDDAELQLHKAIKAGAPWAIKFVLSTRGLERGYSKKQEIAHSGGVKQIKMVMDIADTDE